MSEWEVRRQRGCVRRDRERWRLPLDESGLPSPDFHTIHQIIEALKGEILTAQRTGEKQHDSFIIRIYFIRM